MGILQYIFRNLNAKYAFYISPSKGDFMFDV